MKAQDFVRPGDCLLYRPRGVFGWIIAVKTWHRIAHVEVAIGDGEAVASRDGVGVGRYPLRLEDLAYILRPRAPFNLSAALRWFATVDDQRYDWVGLMRFVLVGSVAKVANNRAQFCSEFATRFYRAGALEPFHASEDADAIAPATFLLSEDFDHLEVDKAGEVSPEIALEGV